MLEKERSTKANGSNPEANSDQGVSPWNKYKYEETVRTYLQGQDPLDEFHTDTLKIIGRLFQLCRACAENRQPYLNNSNQNNSKARSSLSKMAEIVLYAFENRKRIQELSSRVCDDQNPLSEEAKSYILKLVREVDFLSRSKAQLETLEEIARLKHIQRLEYDLLPLPQFPQLDQKAFLLALEQLPRGSKATDTRGKLLRKFRNKPSLFEAKIHCEMQLLLHFDKPGQTSQYHTYFGVSKKSCWQCATILTKHGTFRSSGTHARVSGLWTIDSQYPSEALAKANQVIA